MTEMENPDVTVRKTYQIYLYTVCFVTVLVLLFACAQALYAIVRIVAPDTTGAASGLRFGGSFGGSIPTPNERDAGIAQLIQHLILGAITAVVFVFHWTQATKVRADLERAIAGSPAEATDVATGA